jgi:hypothetical protein
MRPRIVTIALVFLYILLTRGLVEALSGVADAFAQRPDVPGQVPVLISLLVLLLFGGALLANLQNCQGPQLGSNHLVSFVRPRNLLLVPPTR